MSFFVCFQMIAKGKDCTELFPAVVKNVVSKNSEVRKMAAVLSMWLGFVTWKGTMAALCMWYNRGGHCFLL